MSRARCYAAYADAAGNKLSGTAVYVYNPGTTTPITETIYDSFSAGGALSNPLTTDANGGVLFYLAAPKRVDLQFQKAGYADFTLRNVQVTPDVESIDGALLAVGSVTTAALAAHAVTQIASAIGVTANPTTASVDLVDMPEMANSLIYEEGSDIIAILSCTLSNNAATVMFMGLRLDGGADNGVMAGSIPHANDDIPFTSTYRWSNVAAGEHTVRGRWSVSAGTGKAVGIYRYLLVLEVKR